MWYYIRTNRGYEIARDLKNARQQAAWKVRTMMASGVSKDFWQAWICPTKDGLPKEYVSVDETAHKIIIRRCDDKSITYKKQL